MRRICNALVELAAAAVFLLPLGCIGNRLCFHSRKRTAAYLLFAFYLTAVLALVGFPDITTLKMEPAVNAIPFIYMKEDFANACLNVLLFVPFGFFLPVLWQRFRSAKSLLAAGLTATVLIELSQLFTGRTTDIDDVITNAAGALAGYWMARRLTRDFERGVLSGAPTRDFYVLCIAAAAVMFFLQPFLSSRLWELVP